MGGRRLTVKERRSKEIDNRKARGRRCLAVKGRPKEILICDWRVPDIEVLKRMWSDS